MPLDSVTLVHVDVSKTGPNTYALKVFPQRSGDTTIFHTNPPDTPSPERPREVMWVATGRQPGQKLKFEAKNPGMGYLSRDVYQIDDTTGETMLSGGARQHPQQGSVFRWAYNAILYDAAGNPLAKVDPVIIIEDDP